MRNPTHQQPAGLTEAANVRRARPSEILADAALGAARAAHVAVEDLYVEDSTRSRRVFSAPVPTVRLETAQESRDTGLLVSGNANGDARAWRATSAEEFSAALGFGSNAPRIATGPETTAPPMPSPELRERLHQLIRDMQTTRGMVLQPSVTLTYGDTDFALRSGGNGAERVRGGSIPHFQVDLAATVRRIDETSLWARTIVAFSESTLLEQLEAARDPLASLRLVAEGIDAWPAPRGSFPVLWEPEALVELLSPLLRTVEADQFLAGRSALGGEAGLGEGVSFAFSLQDDGAPESTGGMDQEGTASAPVLLVDAGGVRALATSSGLAGMLGRPATGHARRAGVDSGTSPVLWRPRLEGHERSATLAETLGNGLAVRHCEVTVQDEMATLHVRDARLLHGGVVGERIEAFQVRVNYRELLASLRAFGDRTLPVGRFRVKNGQRWLTEWHLPRAASLGFPIPGSVPAEHYW